MIWRIAVNLCEVFGWTQGVRRICVFLGMSSRMKWNESGFRPLLCTYRLNWARRTSWGWWDDWDDTVLQHKIRNSSPGGLRPSTLPLGHGGSPQYWLSHVDGEETFFCFFQTAETGNRTPNSGVKGSGANRYPRAPALKNIQGDPGDVYLFPHQGA